MKKKYAIRSILGRINNQSDIITDHMRHYIQCNPLSCIVKRSQAAKARNGWLEIAAN